MCGRVCVCVVSVQVCDDWPQKVSVRLEYQTPWSLLERSTQTHAAPHNYEPVQGKGENSIKWIKGKTKQANVKRTTHNNSWTRSRTVYAKKGHIRWQMYACTHRIFLFFSATLAYLLCMHRLPLPVCLSPCLSLCLNISETSFLFIVIHVYVWVTYTVDRRFDSVCLCVREQGRVRRCVCVCVYWCAGAFVWSSIVVPVVMSSCGLIETWLFRFHILTDRKIIDR